MQARKRTYYEVLGVSDTASANEIEAAYQKAQNTKSDEVEKAYTTLKDAKLRDIYNARLVTLAKHAPIIRKVHDAKDHYETLGVKKNATEAEIKTAYKKLSIPTHPDRNDNTLESQEAFKKVANAYETLMDVAKRAEYDDQLDGKTQDFKKPDFNPYASAPRPTPAYKTEERSEKRETPKPAYREERSEKRETPKPAYREAYSEKKESRPTQETRKPSRPTRTAYNASDDNVSFMFRSIFFRPPVRRVYISLENPVIIFALIIQSEMKRRQQEEVIAMLILHSLMQTHQLNQFQSMERDRPAFGFR